MTEKKSKITLIFALMPALAVIVRIISLATIYDFETGFFTNHSNPLVAVFYVLCVLGLVGGAVAEKIVLGKDGSSPRIIPSKVSGIAGLLTSAAMIYDARPGLSDVLSAARTVSGFKAVSSLLGGTVNILIPVFEILAALVIIVLSALALTGKHIEAKIAPAVLIPVFWALCNIIRTFSITASYIKQSQIFVELFFWLTATVAFLAYARRICNIGLKESGYFFRPASFGVCAFAVMMIAFFVFTGNYSRLPVVAGVLIFFAAALIAPTKATDEPEEAPENEPETPEIT